jgi:hypothetical protein
MLPPQFLRYGLRADVIELTSGIRDVVLAEACRRSMAKWRWISMPPISQENIA